MHDHRRPQVIDPEIVIVVVAQRAHYLQGLLLGRFTAQRTGGLKALVVGQYTRGRLYDVTGFLGLGLVQITMDLT